MNVPTYTESIHSETTLVNSERSTLVNVHVEPIAAVRMQTNTTAPLRRYHTGRGGAGNVRNSVLMSSQESRTTRGFADWGKRVLFARRRTGNGEVDGILKAH